MPTVPVIFIKVCVVVSTLIVCHLAPASPVSAIVSVGDKAPDFCLPAQDGSEVCLEHIKGNQNELLLFYVLDFTPG